ncbi:MAG: peptide deformylase [Oscillospiraceae bacterium]|jgi:peptide deformylase|nr:MAG: peptide deformylase [Oscillospiraceae bacterium]
MATLNIIKEGDPILRKISKPVKEITPRILRLLDDMKETLIAAEGAGLAAVQVGVLRRIVLVEHEKAGLLELINPEIIKSSDARQQELEGCLSIPGKWGITDRPESVTIRAMDRNGKYFTMSGDGLSARAFCHELDHLDGILYTDRAVHMLTPEELKEMND